MRTRKTLQELTLKDNFLFGAVMSDENNCHRLLELILQIPIERVIVSKEKSILYHPEYKGVRLDVYAQDENHTHYNVEMQAVKQRTLGKREMEESYITWRYNLFIQDERFEAKEEGLVQGKAEDIIELLTEIEPVPEELQAKIMSETDLSVLKTWLKLAAKSESMDQFLQYM